jgi:hypothetical protein
LGDEILGEMKLKDIILDSLRFSGSDLKVLILLGVVLLIADVADELSFAGDISSYTSIIVFFTIIIMAIFEAGYVFRIIEETIHGSTKLPKFNKLGEMFSHGLIELIVLLAYFLIPLLFLLIFFLNFLYSMDLNDLPGELSVLFIILLGLAVVIYALFPAVLLHRAHHNGDLKSSFDFKKIYHKIRTVGLKRLVVVYLGIFIMVAIIKEVLQTSVTGAIPLVGDLISDLLIAPYLLVFTARVLGLIDN